LDGGPKLEWASLALYAVALLEKETAVVLPCLIFAHAWLFDESKKSPVTAGLKRSTLAALPYLFITTIYLGVRLMVLHQLSMVITPVPLRDMALSWPGMLVFYAGHLLWPIGLSALYAFPVLHRPDLWHFFIPCLILVIIGAGVVRWSRRSRVAAFATLMLVLPLLPAMNLRGFARVEIVHDRYLYLPSAGFAILAALALRGIRAGSRGRLGVPAIQLALLFVLACGFAFGTIQQQGYWADNLSLFRRAVSIAPNNEIANQGMGTALLLDGRVADAVHYYTDALELNPNMAEGQYSLGRCFYELGMYPDSEVHFQRAAALLPTDPKPYLYYGLAKFREGQMDLAERALRYAIRIKGPDDYREYHLSLGIVLQREGAIAQALQEFQAEARENPDPSSALQHIAEIKTESGRSQ
jgi:tetratricopeptide (TPR) repeat protein